MPYEECNSGVSGFIRNTNSSSSINLRHPACRRKQEIEVTELFGTNDTCVYTYQINAIDKIDNLVFVEHRVNRFTNAVVYRIEGTPFKVRLVVPDEDDEIKDPFIRVYKN